MTPRRPAPSPESNSIHARARLEVIPITFVEGPDIFLGQDLSCRGSALTTRLPSASFAQPYRVRRRIPADKLLGGERRGRRRDPSHLVRSSPPPGLSMVATHRDRAVRLGLIGYQRRSYKTKVINSLRSRPTGPVVRARHRASRLRRHHAVCTAVLGSASSTCVRSGGSEVRWRGRL
jgi:hypothetical protein